MRAEQTEAVLARAAAPCPTADDRRRRETPRRCAAAASAPCRSESDLPKGRAHQRADEHHVAAAGGARQRGRICRPCPKCRPVMRAPLDSRPGRRRHAAETATPCGRARRRNPPPPTAGCRRRKSARPGASWLEVSARAHTSPSDTPASPRLAAMVSGRFPARMKVDDLRHQRVLAVIRGDRARAAREIRRRRKTARDRPRDSDGYRPWRNPRRRMPTTFSPIRVRERCPAPCPKG